jgi:ABC-2 type transport system permease protein
MKASLALRGAFWVRAGFMFANNFIFMVMWWVFFDRFDEVRGWRMADMAALYGVCAAAFGLSIVVGAGVRELSTHIVEGDLDAYLTQPQSPLLRCVASRSEASGWGDVASAVVFFGLCGYVSPALVPVCVLTTVCGCLVFLATGVLFHASAFWFGDTRTLSRQAHDTLLIFSLYPSTVFSGWLKVLLYTAVPAGFISFLPVELLRDFSWRAAGAVVGGTAAYVLLAAFVFARGLRRYESGNRFV